MVVAFTCHMNRNGVSTGLAVGHNLIKSLQKELNYICKNELIFEPLTTTYFHWYGVVEATCKLNILWTLTS